MAKGHQLHEDRIFDRPRRWTIPALILGLAAGATECSYLLRVRPLQADLGIQLSTLLLLGWVILAFAAFARKERNAWWSLPPLPIAMIGPVFLVMLVIGCQINDANCP